MFDVSTFLLRWLFLSNLIRDASELQAISHYQPPPPSAIITPEEAYRQQCLHGILSYPPGSSRLMMVDALRIDLVQKLAASLRESDAARRRSAVASILPAQKQGPSRSPPPITTPRDPDSSESVERVTHRSHESAVRDHDPQLELEVTRATNNVRNLRECLPQLVSAVLKVPSASQPGLANPVHRLRQLILQRCLDDPSWGIELCWLLEAEVGRAWKSLFEHRQQTGRRLIVVLPAEKAAVLAKIGSEKRDTFDMLQDAEQATAYGYTVDAPEAGIAPPRLPSSLSLRRCSHFGDTMHFVDRLTKISLDLRLVPTYHREDYLHEQLHEMNRRIRRRMATRGEVSLDVEDQRSPYDWPTVGDLTMEMLHHSVHFPLIPQTVVWPTGSTEAVSEDKTKEAELVRVLNIVVPESRILSSRERCPFLVQLEVADSGLQGSDARLYATGGQEVGLTIEETLDLSDPSPGTMSTPGFQVPAELLRSTEQMGRQSPGLNGHVPRGGSDQPVYFSSPDGVIGPNPYEDLRQTELEQLHQQMQYSPPTSPTGPIPEHPTVSLGAELLEKVFGEPWAYRCEMIRRESSFGHVKGWRLASFIMKAGEDIRRESLVMQIISKMQGWFESEIPEAYRPHLRPYTIMCVGGDAGLVECLSDAKSIDEVKKRTDGFETLRDYFERAYGSPGYQSSSQNSGLSFDEAQGNFLRSLVGYSLVCFILQIKDRHNANILLDRDGHIMHIDFGFVLGDTPKMGKVPIFSERAPFKLSQEFWDVLGGWNISNGGLGVQFCKMFEIAFECASRHVDEIATLVEASLLSLGSSARSARAMASAVRSRLRMRGPSGSHTQKAFIMDLVNAALTSWGTSTYDWLQRNMNGYQ